MPVTYEECSENEYAILERLKRQYRDDLVEAEANIALFFVLDTESNSVPALMVRGKVARGSAKVNSVSDRAEGKADATIRLDRFLWGKMTTKQRDGLIHHELSHIGCPNPKKTDSLGRPILKPIHADWETDGFDEVIQLYGDDAPEKINLNIIRERLRIQGLNFGDEDEAEAQAESESESEASVFATAMGDAFKEAAKDIFGNDPILKDVGITLTSGGKTTVIKEGPSEADGEPPDSLPGDDTGDLPSHGKWRDVAIATIAKRLPVDAVTALHDEYELRTLGDVADFFAGGERLHELPLLGLDSAALLAEDIDIHRCEHDDGSAAGIDAEWLADTLAAYRENEIESAKVKGKGKAPAKSKAAKAEAMA